MTREQEQKIRRAVSKETEQGDDLVIVDHIIAALRENNRQHNSKYHAIRDRVEAIEADVRELEEAQKADEPKCVCGAPTPHYGPCSSCGRNSIEPIPDINDSSTCPEVKPEDVRVGDRVCHGLCVSYVDSVSDKALAAIRVRDLAVVTYGKDECFREHYITLRRPPLEVGQLVEYRGGAGGGTIRRINPDGTVLVWGIWYAQDLVTPATIAPSLDPRNQDERAKD